MYIILRPRRCYVAIVSKGPIITDFLLASLGDKSLLEIESSVKGMQILLFKD